MILEILKVKELLHRREKYTSKPKIPETVLNNLLLLLN